MAMEAVAAYGTAQEINDENGDPYETMEVIESTIEYMNTIENKLSPTAKKYCRNGHKECSIFAVDDECNSEIEYMAITCAPTCKLCHLFNAVDGVKSDDYDIFRLLSDYDHDYDMDDLISEAESSSIKDMSPVDILLLNGVKNYGVEQMLPSDNDSFIPFMTVITKTLLHMRDMGLQDEDNTCFNDKDKCALWAVEGKCVSATKKKYMLDNCSPSCQTCDKKIFKDTIIENKIKDKTLTLLLDHLNKDELIQTFEVYAKEDFTPDEILLQKGIQKYGVVQHVASGDKEVTMEVIKKTLLYMRRFDKKTIKSCTNKDVNCADWAMTGECDRNEVFMKEQCAPLCGLCEIEFDVEYMILTKLIDELRNEIIVDEGDELYGYVSETDLLLLRAVEKYGVQQTVEEDEYDDEDFESIQNVLASTVLYMRGLDDIDLIKKCRNLDELCAYQANEGDCDDDEDFVENCRPTCRACHELYDDE